MVNEAKLYKETHVAVSMTCTDGTGIERGALLTLSDPNTAAVVTASLAAVAGIANEEKIASDGVTAISVHRGGQFIVSVSGSVAVGEAVQFTHDNKVLLMNAEDEHQAGIMLEAATNGQTALFELRPGHRNL